MRQRRCEYKRRAVAGTSTVAVTELISEMDFGVSSVFELIGQGISLAKAIWKVVQSSFKDLQNKNREMQRQVSVLKSILESINQVDTVQDPSVAKELQKSLNNLHVIMKPLN